ncbi:nucleotidyl transferase family protein [Limnoglobus roseus]|uniref:Cytidyltransferase-like domain-containing protein n=1 Tax=Limnoglobus roseus TaxID=2598579 RepID=A0A5C1AAM2_9BACT|nr:hypothetical protein [Limnoglobus roseus]QEL15223.1 hypothetical protein PX52LOC_02138 [Limnoglobus roseus]
MTAADHYCHEPDGSTRTGSPLPAVVFPGSFNPLHDGHTTLAEVAARVLGLPVAFELSTANVDKPGLAADEVTRRVAQFRGHAPVWVTRAATFARKAELFPGATFVVGFDTAVRLIDPKYYGGDPALRDAGLRTLLDRDCRVLVGGRMVGEGFRVWEAALVGEEFRTLFTTLGEDDFRRDRSSTELRNR